MSRDQPQPGSFLNKGEEPGNEVAKTSVCKNLLNLDSCLSNNVCRNCVDKNSTLLDLLKKADSVLERFNVVAVNLIEKNHTTATKNQRGARRL